MSTVEKSNLSRVGLAAAVLALSGGLGAYIAAPAGAQPGPDVNFFSEYAVKFVCGTAAPGPNAPAARGAYFTAVNVHNPGKAITVGRKVATALPNRPGEITGFEQTPLRHDQAVEFGCQEIRRQAGLSPLFQTGFLVIRVPVPHELDVVAVYSAASAPVGTVTTLHTERVPARRVAVPFTLPDGGVSKGN